MKINSVRQLYKEDILDRHYDLLIVSSGYEERSTYLASQIKNVTRKIAIGFSEGKNNDIRSANDALYSNDQFERIECSVRNAGDVISYLERFIHDYDGVDISILVDYSSMPRVWYSSIINYFNVLNNCNKTLNIIFTYSRADFTPPPAPGNENSNYFFGPIAGFDTLSIPNNPTALIIGLGYEKLRASGLKEYFDADEMYVYYTDKNSAPEFYESVLERNTELIKDMDIRNIFPYPIDDLLYSKKILKDICSDIYDDYRIIIAPCGPKPFTLLSLIVASELPGIDVWRISGETGESGGNKVASGEVLSLCVEYGNN